MFGPYGKQDTLGIGQQCTLYQVGKAVLDQEPGGLAFLLTFITCFSYAYLMIADKRKKSCHRG